MLTKWARVTGPTHLHINKHLQLFFYLLLNLFGGGKGKQNNIVEDMLQILLYVFITCYHSLTLHAPYCHYRLHLVFVVKQWILWCKLELLQILLYYKIRVFSWLYKSLQQSYRCSQCTNLCSQNFLKTWNYELGEW